jgi:hypothetical protein
MSVTLSKYEFFEQGYAQLAVHLGCMSPLVFMKFIHYKEVLFQMNRNGHNKTTAVQITADISRTSTATVWRSVHYFEK